jgi:lysophospholipase L1-like esterase
MANPAPQNKRPRADEPAQRTDRNSQIAHQELLDKARKGRIDLYFLGDSITRRWGTSDLAWRTLYDNWKENFFGWNAANFGWGGDTTQNILWRLHNGELDNVNPKAIVVLAGTNNLPSGASDEEIARGVKAIVDTCRSKAPKATIILTAIFPRSDDPRYQRTIDLTNDRLQQIADGKHVRFLNVNPGLSDANGKLLPQVSNDGLHLNVEGYKVWANGLRPLLTDILGPRNTTDQAPPPTGDPSVRGKG